MGNALNTNWVTWWVSNLQFSSSISDDDNKMILCFLLWWFMSCSTFQKVSFWGTWRVLLVHDCIIDQNVLLDSGIPCLNGCIKAGIMLNHCLLTYQQGYHPVPFSIMFIIDFPFHAYNQVDNSLMLCAIIIGPWIDILCENLWRGL